MPYKGDDDADNNRLLTRKTIWDSYRDAVRKYRDVLELSEDVLYKLLFWMPHRGSGNNDVNNVWREVGYGLLSLHRLGMELALSRGGEENLFGMSVQTEHPPIIPATTVRIGLTVLQSFLPSVLAIAQSSVGHERQQRYYAKVRLRLEQIKFALRMYLLMHYWKQQQGQDSAEQAAPLPGIMMNGGLYTTHQGPMMQGLSWEYAQVLEQRQAYVGKRTGWKLGTTTTMGQGGRTEVNLDMNDRKKRRERKCIVLGEVLHTLRPLLWAWMESKYPNTSRQGDTGLKQAKSSSSNNRELLMRAWCLCLGMDLLSIRLLQPPNNNGTASRMYLNPATLEELRQRKMRLLLYTLRSPVWDQATLPQLEKISQSILRRVPLVGGIAETYLMDWILYYQHPFIAEEQ
jgi:Peroxisomal membrane protein (Pex16)